MQLTARSPRAALAALKARAKTDPRAREALGRLAMSEVARIEATRERLFPPNRVPGVVYVEARLLPRFMPKSEVGGFLKEAIAEGLVVPSGKGRYLISMSAGSSTEGDSGMHKRSFSTEPTTPEGKVMSVKGTGLRPPQSTSFSLATQELLEERQFWGGARAATTRTAIRNAIRIHSEFEEAVKEKDPVVTLLSKIGKCEEAPFLKPGAVFKPVQNPLYTGDLLGNEDRVKYGLERGIIGKRETRAIFKKASTMAAYLIPASQRQEFEARTGMLFDRSSTLAEALALGNASAIQKARQRLSEDIEQGKVTREERDKIVGKLERVLSHMPPTMRMRSSLGLLGIPPKMQKQQVVFMYSLGPNAVGKRIIEITKRDSKEILRAYGFERDTLENRVKAAKAFLARLLLARYLVEERLKGRLGDDVSGYPISDYNATPTHFTDLDSIDLKKFGESGITINETFFTFCEKLGIARDSSETILYDLLAAKRRAYKTAQILTERRLKKA